MVVVYRPESRQEVHLQEDYECVHNLDGQSVWVKDRTGRALHKTFLTVIFWICSNVGSYFSALFLVKYLQVTLEGKSSITQVSFGKNSLIRANRC